VAVDHVQAAVFPYAQVLEENLPPIAPGLLEDEVAVFLVSQKTPAQKFH